MTAPMRIETYAHTDGRECLNAPGHTRGWSWVAFAGDEQSSVRIACDRPHPAGEKATP